MNMKENTLVTKSFEFAIRIVKLYKYMVAEKREFILSKQLLRAGTSVGANIEESQGGYSKKDFRHKLSISYKEIREVKYWLKLLVATDYISQEQFESIYNDADELGKLLYSIIKNTKV